jgi:hypothetical protein
LNLVRVENMNNMKNKIMVINKDDFSIFIDKIKLIGCMYIVFKIYKFPIN